LTGDDRIPTCGEHRGVPLHADQSSARLKAVKADIDEVYALTSLEALFAFATDLGRAPEARMFAAAKVRAAFDLAVEERRERPAIDLDLLDAHVAGLDSLEWRSPFAYCTLGDDHERAVEREVWLEK
jgi:hypothetical protein